MPQTENRIPPAAAAKRSRRLRLDLVWRILGVALGCWLFFYLELFLADLFFGFWLRAPRYEILSRVVVVVLAIPPVALAVAAIWWIVLQSGGSSGRRNRRG